MSSPGSSAPLPSRVPPGVGTWPALHLDDLSDIPFTDGIVGIARYQMRARIRAGSDDVVALTCAAMPEYERYNRDVLGLGSPRFVHAEPWAGAHALAASCKHGDARAQLVAAARRAGRVVLHPYMGTAEVWELAALLEEESGVPVRVLAPPPEVAAFANDKWSMAQLVAGLLGPGAVPECVGVVEPEGMANALRGLACRHERVALKLVSAASAMGLSVYEADDVLGREEVRVAAFLEETRWQPGDTVLVSAWVPGVLESPSCQVWLEPGGGVRVDGVFTQLLDEDNVFVGSRPFAGSERVARRIEAASVTVGEALRRMGYVGRCSFDFVVTEDALVFVECNGRWGGTSTPMHLVDRLFDERPPYVAMDLADSRLVGADFEALRQLCGDDLYRPDTGRGRLVLYNVACLAEHGKFDVIALGEAPGALAALDRLRARIAA